MNKFNHPLKVNGKYEIVCLIGYFLTLLAIVFCNGGNFISTCPNGATLSFHSNHIDILECYGYADVASYIRYFLSLDEHGLIDTIKKYHFASWPPGFAYLEMLLYYLFGEKFIIPMALLVVMLWSTLMYQIRNFLYNILKINIYTSTLSPLFLVCFSFVNGFLLKDGLLMSESVATPLFGIFIVNACSLIYKIKYSCMVSIPGVLLVSALAGGLSFVRAQYDLVISALIALSFLVLILSKRNFSREMRAALFRGLTLFFIGYASLTVPYKIFMGASGKPFAMASVAPPYWASESRIRENPYAGFIADGGGHVLCEINPKQCHSFYLRKANGDSPTSAEYFKAAIITAVRSPIKLFFAKGPYLIENSLYDQYREPHAIYSNLILFVSFILSFLFYCSKRGIFAFLVLGCMLSIAAGSLGYGFLDHFEPRYFIPVKLFAILSIIFMLFSGYNNGLKKIGKY